MIPGKRIANELLARGWTQADLARKMNVDNSYVTKLVKGQRQVDRYAAIMLARAFNTTYEEWLV